MTNYTFVRHIQTAVVGTAAGGGVSVTGAGGTGAAVGSAIMGVIFCGGSGAVLGVSGVCVTAWGTSLGCVTIGGKTE